MTKIKFCGIMEENDIRVVNSCRPDYIGFVFSERNRRRVTADRARSLKSLLDPGILTVGVFTDPRPEEAAALLSEGIIDLAELRGMEDEIAIRRLKMLTEKPVIKSYRVETVRDIYRANMSPADLVMLDAGAGGSGVTFDRTLLAAAARPYFLSGGLRAETVSDEIRIWKPWGVNVSAGIETNGKKDPVKMADFVRAVRKADQRTYGERTYGE